MEFWTAFIIGLTGSLHCIGMCGPIVLALPNFSESKIKILFGRLLYNSGRVISYMIIGAFFGMIGNRLLMAGLQQVASILLGISIALAVLLPQGFKNAVANWSPVKALTSLLKKIFFKISKNGSTSTMLSIGVLNGFLPCGLVYVAAFGATSTGDVFSGIIYMAIFGIGTIPVMLATAMAGSVISLNVRRKMRKAVPVFALLLALVFILRGLELGIPFISPKLQHMAEHGKMMEH